MSAINDMILRVSLQIAEELGEIEEQPRQQIFQIVQALGRDQALGLAAEARQIADAGGMVSRDGQPRTVGGIFFHLARSRVNLKAHVRIWPGQLLPRSLASQARRAPRAPVEAPVSFSWQERGAVYQQIVRSAGEIRTVKVTLIGRPGRVVEQGSCVITTMRNVRVPALPKGLPSPPSEGTIYGVYLTRKQWSRVADALKNADDLLIVEGFAAYDSKLQGIAVFAMAVTTRNIQAAKRQAASTGGDEFE